MVSWVCLGGLYLNFIPNMDVNGYKEQSSNGFLVKALDFQSNPNPGVWCSKPLVGSKVDSVFHPSKVDQMNTRNF